jgi:hypothetical protein
VSRAGKRSYWGIAIVRDQVQWFPPASLSVIARVALPLEIELEMGRVRTWSPWGTPGIEVCTSRFPFRDMREVVHVQVYGEGVTSREAWVAAVCTSKSGGSSVAAYTERASPAARGDARSNRWQT